MEIGSKYQNYNFSIIFVGWDFNRYKSFTFWIGGIGCTFWSWDNIDIFCSVLHKKIVLKNYTRYKIDFLLSSWNFVSNQNENDIANSLTSGDISCQFPFCVRVTCYTLVNTQHSTTVNTFMKQKNDTWC